MEQQNEYTVKAQDKTNSNEYDAFTAQVLAKTETTPLWIDQQTGRPNIQDLSALVIITYNIKLRGSKLIDSTKLYTGQFYVLDDISEMPAVQIQVNDHGSIY